MISKKFVVASSIFALTAIVSGGIWLSQSSSVQGQDQDQKSVNGVDDGLNIFRQLNEKARKAKSGDELAVQQLTEQVFDSFRLNEFPDYVKQEFKSRINQSEVNYRQGKRQGLSDKNVVDAVNEIASKFNAPQYAKTSLGEVRLLRMGLLPILPDLIAGGKTSKKNEVESFTAQELSPVEAVYFAMFILEQKQINPAFLLTDEERAAKKAEPEKEQKNQTPQLRAEKKTERQEEIEFLIKRGEASMTDSEKINLARQSLDILGIDK